MNRPEDDLQRAAIELIRLRWRQVVCFHVPNGGARSRKEAAIMKGLGVLAGAPDLLLLGPRGHALCLELKAPKGRMSVTQRAFQAACNDLRVPYFVCRDLDQIRDVVEEWLQNVRRSIEMVERAKSDGGWCAVGVGQ